MSSYLLKNMLNVPIPARSASLKIHRWPRLIFNPSYDIAKREPSNDMSTSRSWVEICDIEESRISEFMEMLIVLESHWTWEMANFCLSTFHYLSSSFSALQS